MMRSTPTAFALPTALAVPTVLAALFTLSACAAGSGSGATPRERDQVVVDPQGGFTDVLRIENESLVTRRVIDAPVNRVWSALLEVYEELEIPVGELDEARGQVGNAGFPVRRIAGRRMAEYVDCGHGVAGPKANEYAVRVALFTTVRPHEEGTELVTDMDATARPRDVSGSTIHCTSEGRLEALIVQRVEDRLAG